MRESNIHNIIEVAKRITYRIFTVILENGMFIINKFLQFTML